MSISTWLSNGKVKLSNVQTADKNIIVCTSDVGSHRVIYVEDVQSGQRILGPVNQHLASEQDINDLVINLAEQL